MKTDITEFFFILFSFNVLCLRILFELISKYISYSLNFGKSFNIFSSNLVNVSVILHGML